MTILLVAIAWTLILSLIVGLCGAARQGDVAQPEQHLAWQWEGQADRPSWEGPSPALLGAAQMTEPAGSLRDSTGIAA